jgi:hypothetical protein
MMQMVGELTIQILLTLTDALLLERHLKTIPAICPVPIVANLTGSHQRIGH